MVKLHARITSANSLLIAGADVEHTGLTLDDLDAHKFFLNITLPLLWSLEQAAIN